jgi:uncharacterized protein (DUF58 family)
MSLAILLLICATFWHPLFYLAWGLLVLLSIMLGLELYQLKSVSKDIKGSRVTQEKLSLGDLQDIQYQISNTSNHAVNISLVDELPLQFQYRKEITELTLAANGEKIVEFPIFPSSRGEYHFGTLYAYLSLPTISLVQLRVPLADAQMVMVYPSILQMKKYALHVMYKAAHMYGIRKVRTIGENDEFEHIRTYQYGDNEKSINWKATSKKGELLVNQFQDSRSQNVYCIVDKGRTMEMSFHKLTLLDHAINSALVIANITLQKYDKAGLITFCNNIDTLVPAASAPTQLELILKSLYAQTPVFKESNFELLYLYIRKKITKRSIIFLYTNFENKVELERNLPFIRMVAKQHLLVVILFINTELNTKAELPPATLSEIYEQTIAQSLLNEKEDIARELNKYGIQTILTKPEDLSINVINKYLEIKAKRSK